MAALLFNIFFLINNTEWSSGRGCGCCLGCSSTGGLDFILWLVDIFEDWGYGQLFLFFCVVGLRED